MRWLQDQIDKLKSDDDKKYDKKMKAASDSTIISIRKLDQMGCDPKASNGGK